MSLHQNRTCPAHRSRVEVRAALSRLASYRVQRSDGPGLIKVLIPGLSGDRRQRRIRTEPRPTTVYGMMRRP